MKRKIKHVAFITEALAVVRVAVALDFGLPISHVCWYFPLSLSYAPQQAACDLCNFVNLAYKLGQTTGTKRTGMACTLVLRGHFSHLCWAKSGKRGEETLWLSRK
ncbi:hypothetical protein V8F20_007148 [Naviculisporaceae sp. PSN 640]